MKCESCLRCQLLAAGANPDALAMLEGGIDGKGATAINWQALLALLLQYGPQILALILSLLNPPAPTPAPVTKP